MTLARVRLYVALLLLGVLCGRLWPQAPWQFLAVGIAALVLAFGRKERRL